MNKLYPGGAIDGVQMKNEKSKAQILLVCFAHGPPTANSGKRRRCRRMKFCASTSSTTIMQSSFDRRRVNGPEESYSPVYDSDEEPESSSMAARRNGRSARDVRPICACVHHNSFVNTLFDILVQSFKDGSDKSGEWIGLRRDGEDEDRMCGLRTASIKKLNVQRARTT